MKDDKKSIDELFKNSTKKQLSTNALHVDSSDKRYVTSNSVENIPSINSRGISMLFRRRNSIDRKRG